MWIPDCFSMVTNLLAVEVHQALRTSSDISFDLRLAAVIQPAREVTLAYAVDIEPMDADAVLDAGGGALTLTDLNRTGPGTIGILDHPGEPGRDLMMWFVLSGISDSELDDLAADLRGQDDVLDARWLDFGEGPDFLFNANLMVHVGRRRQPRREHSHRVQLRRRRNDGGFCCPRALHPDPRHARPARLCNPLATPALTHPGQVASCLPAAPRQVTMGHWGSEQFILGGTMNDKPKEPSHGVGSFHVTRVFQWGRSRSNGQDDAIDAGSSGRRSVAASGREHVLDDVARRQEKTSMRSSANFGGSWIE